MIETAIEICSKSLSETDDDNLMFGATWLTADLHHIKSSISYERNEENHGLALSKTAKSIRESVSEPGDPFFEFWLILSDGQISLSLMAEGRAEEALPLIQNLLDYSQRPIEDGSSFPNLEVFLQNSCLCYLLLGKLEEADNEWTRSEGLIREQHGEESQLMATLVPRKNLAFTSDCGMDTNWRAP
jgi:tetratricopeptide (TPR) repeat protein